MTASDYLRAALSSAAAGYVLLRMAAVALLTVAAYRLLVVLFKRRRHESISANFLFNMLRVMTVLTGGLGALSQIPDFSGAFATLLTGSGIAALAIGLAAQESLANAINGIVLTISKPFDVGDRVHLMSGSITGFVENITLRHTVVRTFINSRIIIPNSVINKEMIENSDFTEERASAFVDAIITHDSDLELACQTMADVIGAHPDYVDPREPGDTKSPRVAVYVRALSVFGVELRASMWTKTVAINFVACSEVRRALKKAFDEAGVKFAQSESAALPPGSG